MKDKARSDLAVDAWNALKGAAWPAFGAIGERTLSFDSTPAQISLLNVLYDARESLTPLVVARALDVTPATVTGTLNRLEDTGLVERARGESEDRRIVNLRLTAKGRDLVKRWREACRAHFETMMSPLSDAELRTLISLLARIAPSIEGVPPGLASTLTIEPKPRARARRSRRADPRRNPR